MACRWQFAGRMKTILRLGTALLAVFVLYACTAPAPTGVSRGPTTNTGTDTGPKDDGDVPDLAYAYATAPDLATALPDDLGGGGPCGTVTELGDCAGNVSRWCDNGALMTEDCGAEGATCASDQYGSYCTVGSGAGIPCGTVTANGTCTGATLKFCDDDNQLETVDCTPYGGCSVDGSGFADCNDPSGP